MLSGGRTLATTSFLRTGFPGVKVTPEELAQNGFLGTYVTPGSSASPVAVLLLGGSEGGIPGNLYGAYFALHGCRALDLGYFDAPGLPSTLSDIPLEYFARALTWLHQQPGVQKVVVVGVSRGSEAALLLGVHYPTLVQGVFVASPSSVALYSYPGCDGPAWTYGGQPVPYSRQYDTTAPLDDPDAVIPVGQIHTPILLACGGADQVWVSCSYARAIRQELMTAHDSQPVSLDAYPTAGHAIADLVPYQPRS